MRDDRRVTYPLRTKTFHDPGANSRRFGPSIEYFIHLIVVENSTARKTAPSSGPGSLASNRQIAEHPQDIQIGRSTAYRAAKLGRARQHASIHAPTLICYPHRPNMYRKDSS